MEQFRGTTIVSIRRDGNVAIAGDGQVSMGSTVMKGNARKVRPLAGGKVLMDVLMANVERSPVEVRCDARVDALLLKEMQSGEAAVKSREYMEKVAAASYDEILGDPDMMDFTRSVTKGLFGDNCAACHGSGGEGVVGLFPNLADDDWLWGGSEDQIRVSIAAGRNGVMPAWGAPGGGPLTEQQLEAALRAQASSGVLLGQILVDKQWVPETEVLQALGGILERRLIESVEA